MGKWRAGVRAAVVTVVVVASGVSVAAARPAGCAGWRVDTVASGLGWLENLEPDGHSGFYLSGGATLLHLDAAGRVRVLATMPGGLTGGPGGMQLAGRSLYFVTGDGGLWRMDTITGHRTELAGVVVPNGLLRLPSGVLLAGRVGTDASGPPTGITRYDPSTGLVTPLWSTVPRSEGLALAPDHTAVYTDDLFTGHIIRVPLRSPNRWTVAATIPGVFPGVDDLTIDADDILYVAAHFEGSIYRVDLRSGSVCRIASGLSGLWTGPSSVRIAPDGPRWALYATAYDGTVRRLRPPRGTDLTPTPE